MCVFLVCVLGSFRVSACAFRASELLVVRLSFVVKCFRLRCVSCEIPKFSCRVSNSSFSFEFVVEVRIRVFRFVAQFDFSNFDFRFECRVQVPWIFVSNFEFEFFVSSRYSISRIWFWIRRRIQLLEFRVEFQIRICRRNLSSKFSFRCAIWFLEFRCSIRLLEFRLLESSALNFEFVFSSRICHRISNSSWSIRLLERRFELSSKLLFASRILSLSASSNFATFVARRLKSPIFVLNCKLTSLIILARSLSLRSRCHASFARAFRA